MLGGGLETRRRCDFTPGAPPAYYGVVSVTHHHIACDLGAESGRVMLGTFDGRRLAIEEIHRFPNGAVRSGNSLRWDLPGLYREVLQGLRKVAKRGLPIASLGVDAWAIDFALLRGQEPLLRPAYHYRDPRNERAFRAARTPEFEKLVFERTGIQFMPLNTLYQLLADQAEEPDSLADADRLLMIPDWFHFLLCGQEAIEETNASTTQLYDPWLRGWSEELIEHFNFPRHIFPQIVPPGTLLGFLLPEVQAETGLDAVPVIAGCTHDTAAAVAAVPAVGEDEDWAYLSSGTWSLIGVELEGPLINEAARAANFTNEIGYDGTVRFLKNIVGLWLIQECRRIWARDGQDLDYAALAGFANAAAPLRSLIHPDDPRFHAPEDMPAAIRAYCAETGQPEPQTPGEYARCIFESLALLYGTRLDELEKLTERTLRVLHIVGGGSKNELLNQCAANATGREVLAGPVEATAVGNILAQSLTLGFIPSLAAARAVVRESFAVTRYVPLETEKWLAARARFAALPS